MTADKKPYWWKIGIVVALIVAIGVIVTSKKRSKSDQSYPAISPVNPTAEKSFSNPLEKALRSGRPVLADFGRGTCIPCKAMKPILDELTITYKDRAEILFFDIDKYRDLTNEYQVRLIPTQVFFDKSGNEIWRHEGFLGKDKIIEKLKELGVN